MATVSAAPSTIKLGTAWRRFRRAFARRVEKNNCRIFVLRPVRIHIRDGLAGKMSNAH